MKKLLVFLSVIFFILLYFYIAKFQSCTTINWPDFIKVNEKFYLNRDIAINKSDIGKAVGIIEINSPKKSCKWSPSNNESSMLPIGTEIYTIKDNSLVGIAAYIHNKYIYYEEISEDKFYDYIYPKTN